MSHTYFQNKTTFICNSDLSGEVTIKTKDGELNVNGKDIINFVVDHLKRELIVNIESMDNEVFVKVFLNTR
jgi:hypothetical protein